MLFYIYTNSGFEISCEYLSGGFLKPDMYSCALHAQPSATYRLKKIFKEGSVKDQPISHEYLSRWGYLSRKNNSNQTSLGQFNFWNLSYLLKTHKYSKISPKTYVIETCACKSFKRTLFSSKWLK